MATNDRTNASGPGCTTWAPAVAAVASFGRLGDAAVAARPLDVDVTLLYGYGFPRWRGGPMHWADTVGLPALAADIDGYAAEGAHFWQVAPLLRRLAETNQTFSSLNGSERTAA